MDRVWPIWILIYENGPCLTDLDPDQRKWTVFDWFGSWSTKMDRAWLIWILIQENGSWLANLDPDLQKWTVFDRFGSWFTKIDHGLPIWTLNNRNGPWLTISNLELLNKIFRPVRTLIRLLSLNEISLLSRSFKFSLQNKPLLYFIRFLGSKSLEWLSIRNTNNLFRVI